MGLVTNQQAVREYKIRKFGVDIKELMTRKSGKTHIIRQPVDVSGWQIVGELYKIP